MAEFVFVGTFLRVGNLNDPENLKKVLLSIQSTISGRFGFNKDYKIDLTAMVASCEASKVRILLKGDLAIDISTYVRVELLPSERDIDKAKLARVIKNVLNESDPVEVYYVDVETYVDGVKLE